ncbi:glycine zipper 2TM domain-containing protein [Phenylobacterium montanum]|uniref:17 kDa surface antigen n=1 Tax=Phenylobacterium montanum TaxID=2823693 RepID=A0A975ITA7_9CAUL|nr:glycine zipper 2TM domain-containing protein [Caulobacter sp. S6]QUD86583.1 glycine zipper 2TM domain-containing protein [Caulobacter sp. S6]
MNPSISFRSSAVKKTLVALSLAVAAGSLAACAEDYGPRPYPAYAAGVPSTVEHGVIVSYRPIEFGPGNNGAGAVVGGVAGGVAGNALAHGRDRGLATVAGAVGGALLGNAVQNGDRHPGFAYMVRLRDGRELEIPQPDAQPIPQGAPVDVIWQGGRAQVVPRGYPPR